MNAISWRIGPYCLLEFACSLGFWGRKCGQWLCTKVNQPSKKRAKAVVKVAKTQKTFLFSSRLQKKDRNNFMYLLHVRKFLSLCEDGTKMKKKSKILPPLCALLFVSTKMRTMSQQCVNSWQIADLFMDDAFPIEKNQV